MAKVHTAVVLSVMHQYAQYYLQSAFALPLAGDKYLHPLITQVSILISKQLLPSNSVISLVHH